MPDTNTTAGTPPATLPRTASSSHLVLIPSYNTGRELLRRTVAAALAHWHPVWVVVDGSTDGSDKDLESVATEIPCAGVSAHMAFPVHQEAVRSTAPHTAAAEGSAGHPFPPGTTDMPEVTPPALHVIRMPANGGKGNAVLAGMQAAQRAGFTHVLCFDADGQHPAAAIAPMMELSLANPEATIMGQPIFGSDAPAERLFGRKIANFFTEWESGHCGLGDTLFGMRVYPIAPTLAAMARTCFARRFDFDPEVAVRLCWQGVRPLPFAVPCRYLSKEEGGVSHFNYLRDNCYQVFLHVRLLSRYLSVKWIAMRRHKQRWQASKTASQATGE